MSNNAQKTPFARQLHQFGDDKSQDWLQSLPQRMPVTVTAIVGNLVTVSFDGNWAPYTLPTITIPRAESQWGVSPIQVGDKGFTTVSDKYLGGQSGQGGGTADLYPRANLTDLAFSPVLNTSLAPGRDPNAFLFQGPNGVVLQDSGKMCVLTLTPTGIKIVIGGMTLTIDSSGLTVTGGDIVNNGLTVGSVHVHGGILPGGDNTGPPNP